ncbi:MAG: 2,3,4,5-tetrahydropyridine-2,6-dicarboxylate N-succinyltransferase [Bradymonadaceae bacterium]|nr:2,3,4,5-tetrahydropyridine-2,6-dicarboxylate N-succinyltransferase [Lujinxingiaceae bacterium]
MGYDAGDILNEIERIYALPTGELGDKERELFDAFLLELEAGRLRAARPIEGDAQGRWQAVAGVKKGILLGFRLGHNRVFGGDDDTLQFSDKHTYPAQRLAAVERNIRIVPGGNSVRRGAFIGRNVTMMPPAFVNVGAYVDDATMIDSHALVGSCAQIGKGVHLSAGAQIGGVLEPIGQAPVVIGDNVLVGGNTGLYEGVQVGRGAVIGAGAVITASTPVYDLVHQQIYRATADAPLVIPPGAVVIPGSRPARGEFAESHGLHMATLLIIKYRDEKTDASAALEELLR